MIISDFLLQRKITKFAISVLDKDLPEGLFNESDIIFFLLGKLFKASVSTNPADIALTLILLSANSTAKYFVIVSSAAFDVPTEKYYGNTFLEPKLEILIIDPPSFISFDDSMEQSQGAFAFILNVQSQCFVSSSEANF